MRRLRVSIDPALLGGPEIATDSFDSPPILLAPTRAAQDAGALDAEPQPAVAATTDQATPPLPTPPPPTPVTPTTGTSVSLELWIDARGLIRQLASPDVLGDETLTVTAVSPDEWVPAFPLEEQVQPLTASALVDLGL